MLTRVVINKGGIVHPAKVTSFQTGPMVWLIFNRSGADQTNHDRSNKVCRRLFQHARQPAQHTNTPLTVLIPGAGKKRGIILGIIRDDANQISYLYEIAALNLVDRLVKTIDPDLDVVDPTP